MLNITKSYWSPEKDMNLENFHLGEINAIEQFDKKGKKQIRRKRGL